VSAVPLVSPAGDTAQLDSGEVLALPAELWPAIDAAIAAAGALDDPAAARTAFAGAFAQAVHRSGLILVARAHARTREAVDANVYSMALSAKYAADQTLFTVRKIIGPLPELGTLGSHVEAAIDTLTGHAPPAGRDRLLAALDERLRALRLVVLGTPIDTPLGDEAAPPAAVAHAIEASGAEG
jgi:hypothetical protein